MTFSSIETFVSEIGSTLPGGPVAILLMEDYSETNSTIRHHLKAGFSSLLVLGPTGLEISPELYSDIHFITHNFEGTEATATAINTLMPCLEGRWVYYGYNAEYLFYPYAESRSVAEMVRFATEERRNSILTYVIDLYADDLSHSPDAVSLKSAHLDRSGYYALDRHRDGAPLDRQKDMFGGLRWRFEEHVAEPRRKIDRIGLFKAEKGLQLRPDHTFNIEEMNTYACPWHNNVTAAICSFRAAKSLCTNPGSAEQIDSFKWHNSEKFAWHSQQLMNLGLMEPGQWV